MREILFRGKTFDNEWVYGYYVNQYKCPEIYCQDTSVGERRAIIAETVGQYTGLTDRNGNKIFEGDILKYSDEELLEDRDFDRSVVKYTTGSLNYDDGDYSECCGFTLDIYSHAGKLYKNADCINADCNSFYEVIGNIFDNPELLKGDAEG